MTGQTLAMQDDRTPIQAIRWDRIEAPMKLRSVDDSLSGSLQPFDQQMPLSL